MTTEPQWPVSALFTRRRLSLIAAALVTTIGFSRLFIQAGVESCLRHR